MKKLIIVVLFVVFFSVMSATVTKAGGDKVRGDEGQGGVVQTCVNFDECPYGDENPEK